MQRGSLLIAAGGFELVHPSYPHEHHPRQTTPAGGWGWGVRQCTIWSPDAFNRSYHKDHNFQTALSGRHLQARMRRAGEQEQVTHALRPQRVQHRNWICEREEVRQALHAAISLATPIFVGVLRIVVRILLERHVRPILLNV